MSEIWNLSLSPLTACTSYWDNPLGMQITPDSIPAQKCEVVGHAVVATEKLEGADAVWAEMNEHGNDYDPSLAPEKRTLAVPTGLTPQQFMARLNADPRAKAKAVAKAGRISETAPYRGPGPNGGDWDYVNGTYNWTKAGN